MKKYLLIGSAPYIVDWYKENGLAFKEAGFILVAMNNAWSINAGNVKRWIHGNDFRFKGTLQPVQADKNRWADIETNSKFPEKPYSYKFMGSGTTILNALCHLLNISIGDGEKCIVAIAGADCIYTEGKTHFYGETGSADPVRFGEDWLKTELDRIGLFYKKEKCKIYNVGGRDNTLLPYTAKTPKELAK